jgi:hypothetical protein
MPNTTNHNIYYPDSATNISPLETVFSTLASSVDTAIEALVDGEVADLRTDVDAKATAGALGVPFRMSAGSGTSSSTLGNGSSETIDITFPVGRFSQTPILSLVSSSVRYTLSVASVSSTGFTMNVRNNTSATGTSYTYYWTATQMLVASAAG